MDGERGEVIPLEPKRCGKGRREREFQKVVVLVGGDLEIWESSTVIVFCP